ncbi:MAG: hypothetical protein KF832_19940 [Caldilineaceae bacterium]|nr:hypothetical protein [Caldilineaceae bacterium]
MVRLLILRLLESYFRHRWLYLLPCLLMAGAAYGYLTLQPANYIARGTIYVQDKTLLAALTASGNEGFTWVTPAQITVGELTELLNTQAFLRAIIKESDLEVRVTNNPETLEDTIKEVRKALWTQTLGDNLVSISAAHEMPRVAHQIVAAAIETYISWKTNLSRSDSVAAQTFFADLIKTYEADVEPARAELNTYLQAHPRPVRGERTEQEEAEIARLQGAVNRAEERLQRAQNQEESARLARVQAESDVRQSYSMVDAPMRPLLPERALKTLLLTFMIFMIGGFILTAVGVATGALLDQSFRFPVEVSNTLDLPILATVPISRIETLERVTQPIGEERKALYTNPVTKALRPATLNPAPTPLLSSQANQQQIFG